MTSSKVEITCPIVNSGAAITLNGTQVEYDWRNLINPEPAPGKFDIVEVDCVGFENPQIRLSGVIDVSEDTTTAGFLKELAKVEFDGTTATAIKLVIAAGVDSAVYLKDSSGSNDYIYVVIDNFSLKFSTSIDGGVKWVYDITFVETEVS